MDHLEPYRSEHNNPNLACHTVMKHNSSKPGSTSNSSDHNRPTPVVIPNITLSEKTVPDPPEPQNTINPVNNQIQETINPIVEQDNANPGQNIPNTPPRDHSRPHRIQRPPDRSTYYNPGASLEVFQISVPIHPDQSNFHQDHHFPYPELHLPSPQFYPTFLFLIHLLFLDHLPQLTLFLSQVSSHHFLDV